MSSGGLLDWVFRKVDPILDTADPMHNKVQTWTTGSSTTDGQSPYFQTIFPMVMDAFIPGVGSAIGGLDGASTGNWGKAAIGALGATAQLGYLGSAAADGANGGVAATEATSGLSSTAGVPAGEVAGSGTLSSAPAGYSAGDVGNGISNTGGNMSLGHVNDYSNAFGANPTYSADGVRLTVDATAPASTGTMGSANGLSATQSGFGSPRYVGVGANGGLLADSTASSSQLAAKADEASKLKAYGNLAGNAGKLYIQQSAEAEKAARERAMMQQMQARQAMASGGDAGAQTGRPAQSFQTLSPYAKFNGGFQGRRYGANVRSGLLG